MTFLLPALLFVFVAGLIMVFGYRRYVVAGRTYESLDASPEQGRTGSEPDSRDGSGVVRLARFVSGKIPVPAQTADELRLKLLTAGYRDPSAVAVLYGLKVISMATVTSILVAIEWNSDGAPAMRGMGVLVGVVAGFRLPDYVLARRITLRRKQLRRSLPDALDLIIVCTEAGLTIERSIRVVSSQLFALHRELCEELNLLTAEVGAGLRRKEALENLAIRTQEPEVKKLVGVLTQADRFGTSVGEALRAHADHMRTRRRQLAEEKASKVSVKMIFPIFFFIMPCMMLVTVGPAALIIMKQLIPALGTRHQ